MLWSAAGCGAEPAPVGNDGTDSDTDASAETDTTLTADDTASDGSADDGGPALPPRADQQTCRFDGWAPGLLPPVELELVFEQTVEGATALATDLDAGLLWIGTAEGRVLVHDIDAPTEAAVEVFVGAPTDVITGLAVDAVNDHIFVRSEASGTATVIDRFTIEGDGTLDPQSGVQVLRAPHPTNARTGSGLALSGTTLVIPLGDGESADAAGPAEDRTDRRGNVLRLDVTGLSSTTDAAAAADNPWVDEPSPADEAWALGVRDPAGCAFDSETGALWCADVGATASEVTLTESGADLGWPRIDGPNCLLIDGDCSQLDVSHPDASYRHGGDGCGATGGAVVRDGDLLDGVLVYGDVCSGEVFATDEQRHALVGRWEHPPRAFAADADGTVWAVDADGAVGRVRIIPTEGDFPRQFSASGCYTDFQAVTGSPDAIPYELNAPLWTDGAIKRRHIVLPVGETISVADDGTIAFPEGTVLLKTFSFEFAAGDPASERPVETRVMILRSFGWEFHSYEWDETGTEAELLASGKRVTLALPDGELDYDFPSRAECGYCHSAATPGPLGPRLDQFAREVDYGHTVADQLAAFESIGLFDVALPEVFPMAAPDDESANAEQRARAYLHTNCGHCHRPGGWIPPGLGMDLRYDTPTPDAALCDAPTEYYIPWFPFDVRVVPGDPENSAVWNRLSSRGLGQMPPLATHAVDPGAEAVRQWIAGMAVCPE